MMNARLLTLLGVLLTFSASLVGAAVVDLPQRVQEAVNEELGKDPAAPVTDADMASLTKLDLSELFLRFAPALPHASRLEELDLSRNAIGWNATTVDVSKLESLPSLKRLNLSHNAILTLETLAGLDRIEELDLGGNHLISLDGIHELENLRVLRVNGNSITDFSALKNHPTLEELYIGGREKSGPFLYSPAAPPGLIGETRRNEPEDLQFLSTIPNLRRLGLSELPITDLSPIGQLTQLKELNMSAALLQSDAVETLPLGNLTNLEVLNLSNNLLLDIDSLGALFSLKRLSLSGNLLTSVDFLAGMDELEYLDVEVNPLDISHGSETRQILDQLAADGVTVLKDSTSAHLPNALVSSYQSFDDPDSDGLRRVVLQVSNIDHLFEIELSWDGGIATVFEAGITQIELPVGRIPVTISGTTIHGDEYASSINVLVEAYENTVFIPDGALRDEICEELGLESGTVLSPAHLESLTVLDMTNPRSLSGDPEHPFPPNMVPPPPASLEGLQHAVNLEELHLKGSYKTVVFPIIKFVYYKIHYLDVQGWEALHELDKLRVLTLSEFGSLDLNNLSPLTMIDSLAITDSTVEDGNLLPITGLVGLRELHVTGTSFADLAPVAQLASLQSLSLDQTQLSSADALRGMANLEILSIRHNPLESTEFLADLPVLQEVDLAGSIYFTETTAEHALIEQLRQEGMTVHYEPIDWRPYDLTSRRFWIDENSDGFEAVSLAVSPAAEAVWLWDDQQLAGPEFAASLPLGETRIELRYPMEREGVTFRDSIVVQVASSFSWQAMGIDEAGDVNTGGLVGWVIVPDDSGWVWSWSLNRFIYLREEYVNQTGAWFFAPHDERAVASPVATFDKQGKLEYWGGYTVMSNWVATGSLLGWIYAGDNSGWIYASGISQWLYLPPENVHPTGAWVFSRF